MNEHNERIEKLLERYFAAQATDAEECELRDYFRQAADIPAGLRDAQVLFCGMDALRGEACPQERAARRRGVFARGAWPLWAAAAALAVGLFFGVELLRQPYCYIDGVAVYDKQVAMQTTVYLDAFSEFQDPTALVEELIINE